MKQVVAPYLILILIQLLFANLGASNGFNFTWNFFIDLKSYPIVLYFFIFFLLLGYGITHLSVNGGPDISIAKVLLTSFFFYIVFICFSLGHGPDTEAFNYVSASDLERQTDWIVSIDDFNKRIIGTIASSIFGLLTIIFPILALAAGSLYQLLIKKVF